MWAVLALLLVAVTAKRGAVHDPYASTFLHRRSDKSCCEIRSNKTRSIVDGIDAS